nr:unnamed protein product [Callosobruchus chinensis]
MVEWQRRYHTSSPASKKVSSPLDRTGIDWRVEGQGTGRAKALLPLIAPRTANFSQGKTKFALEFIK